MTTFFLLCMLLTIYFYNRGTILNTSNENEIVFWDVLITVKKKMKFGF